MADPTSESEAQPIHEGMVMNFFRRAAATAFTGRLILRRGAQSLAFYFNAGTIIHGRTNIAHQRLGDILRSELGLSEEVIKAAVKIGQAKDQPLGLVLLGDGVIKASDLYQGLVRQVELMAREAAAWDNGLCYVHQGIVPDAGVVLLRVALPKIFPGELLAPVSAHHAPPTVETAPAKEKVQAAASAKDRHHAHAAVADLEAFLHEKERVAEEDHYGMLGLTAAATLAEIKEAYGKLVRAWHPDHIAHRLLEEDQSRLQGVFARLNAAYAVLSDPQKRAAYNSREKGKIAGASHRRPASPEEQALKLYRAAASLMKEGDYALAADYLRKATRFQPKESKYYYYLGAALYKSRRLRQAEDALSRAIELRRGEADYYIALGRVYKAGKLKAKAKQMFQEALRWNPAGKTAWRELERLDEADDE